MGLTESRESYKGGFGSYKSTSSILYYHLRSIGFLLYLFQLDCRIIGFEEFLNVQFIFLSIHLVPIFPSPSLHFLLKPSSTTPLTLYFHFTFILLPKPPRQPLTDNSGNSKFSLLVFFIGQINIWQCAIQYPRVCILSLVHVLDILHSFHCGRIECKLLFQFSYLFCGLLCVPVCDKFSQLPSGMHSSSV